LSFFMNTQKIRMSTKSTRGFTLVELIVVITILVILGTIAFMNMGSFSASARDSQRTSDLNQINSQIMTIQAKQGIVYTSMLSGTVASTLTNISIGGGTPAAGKYLAGDVNYTVLGMDSTKFDDPTKDVEYKMGATTLAGTAYELAASLEETSTALVMGTFRSRKLTDTASGTLDTTAKTITLDTGLGLFKIGDVIKSTGSGTITAISADLTRITFTDGTPALSVGTEFTLDVAESDGLIASYADDTIAVTSGGANLPYAIQ
ncbi:MAG: type II secretion system protein, partial [Candidatus Gracilibacteria bacterium]|nr:type II secretion system protein [Candidatus Gracilibacteria bacterium]